jgi:hypothetical protein
VQCSKWNWVRSVDIPLGYSGPDEHMSTSLPYCLWGVSKGRPKTNCRNRTVRDTRLSASLHSWGFQSADDHHRDGSRAVEAGFRLQEAETPARPTGGGMFYCCLRITSGDAHCRLTHGWLTKRLRPPQLWAGRLEGC